MKKLSKKTWISIIIISLCGQIAWTVENMLFNVFIQQEFGATLSHIALMVSASAVVATITTLLLGALSDKIGKRKLFITIGYILWGLSIFAFMLLRVDIIHDTFFREASSLLSAMSLGIALTVIFDCIMTLFGSTANDAAFNAWLTDISDDTNRGKIEGVNSAMPLLSVLLVFGLNMIIKKNQYHWQILFGIVGGLALITGVVSIFLVEDKVLEPTKESYFKNIIYGFRPSVIKANKKFYLLLLGFLIFSTSVQVFMPYLILYFTNAIHLENYVLVFAPSIVLAAVFTFFFGKFIDKKGFVLSSIITISIYLLGLLIMTIFTNIVLIFIGTTFMLTGFLSTTAVFNSEIRNKTPEGNVGMFQGIRIVVQVLIPMLVGPWVGALLSGNISEGAFGVVGDEYTPSSFVFLGALIVALFVWIIIFIYNRRKEDVKLQSQDEILS